MASGDRLFGDMTEPEHAYALGFVASAGRVKDGVLSISLRGDGEPLLGMLDAKSASDIPVEHRVVDGVLKVQSPLAELARRFLRGSPGDAEALRFPELAPALGWAFLRGLFDAGGSINSPKDSELEVKWRRLPESFLERVLELVGAPPHKQKKDCVTWRGSAALDLLGQLYGDFILPEVARPKVLTAAARAAAASAATPGIHGEARPYRARPALPGKLPLCRRKHLERFWAWAARVTTLAADGHPPRGIRVQLVRAEAVLPRKERVSDSGYDLTLLYEKSRQGNIVLYGTGVIVEPPFGWYFDVVARSSIVKRGYMLANNVGIIDRAYRGEIFVPLLKTDPNARDLELPARIAQLIPRPVAHFPIVQTEKLTETQRGSGGFGSTGQH